ncbi:MAG: type II secretion system F family protein [Butyrivibrio sp.]|nr:type II secretion system F family protein [Butyrivibrio sp.]
MKKNGKQKELRSYEISSFCRQMALLMKAGIAPASGIDILQEDTSDGSAKKILSSIGQVLKSGEKFHTALKMSEVFPEYVIHMVTIGEESGTLDTVMDSLADYYEREENIESNIKSAVSYPLIMVFMMLVVVIVLVMKVLPIFDQVFSQLGTSMNGFAQSLLNMGNTLSKYSFVLIVIMAVLALLIMYFGGTAHGKHNFRKLMLRIPATKKLIQELETERFASGMVLTLSSGMDTYEGLGLVTRLVESKEMKDKIENCKNLLVEGESFPEALAASNIFSSFYSQMISVGFRSGSMDKAMEQVASRIEKDTQRRIYSLISVLEPTLVIVLSVIVGVILLSVILPLMGIMSTIG